MSAAAVFRTWRTDAMVLQCESHSWLHTALQDPASPGFLLITFVIRLNTPSAVDNKKAIRDCGLYQRGKHFLEVQAYDVFVTI